MLTKNSQTTCRVLKFISVGFVTLLSYSHSLAQAGITWTSQTSAADNTWNSVTYGNSLFVAVASSGTGNRVMTSPDGVTWTSQTSAADNNWNSVAYGNSLFVAVAFGSVMTSPDGITWTSRTSAANNSWTSVTYGNSLFVAVASSGTGNRVMTSPDGITWTSRTSAADNSWSSVTYGNGLFVAVSISGTGNRVMTSSDGVTWTIRSSAADNSWQGVTYGNGLFVAVANSATNQVMTSPDGVTWTPHTGAASIGWRSVIYGNSLYVAVASSGTGNRVMTSPDGITWTSRTSAANNLWWSVTYANGMFVAVSENGTGNRVMTSGTFTPLPVHLISFIGTNTSSSQQLAWDVQNEQDFSHYEVETSTDASTFKSIGSVTAANKEQYSFTNSNPAPAQNYYRLKMVDIDGTYTYSKVIMLLNQGDQQSIRIYPNPTFLTLNITGKNEMKDVILTDANGNQVMHIVVNSNTASFNISRLVPGIYQVQIVTTNGVIVERVTKSR